jgi:hypothetical protein
VGLKSRPHSSEVGTSVPTSLAFKAAGSGPRGIGVPLVPTLKLFPSALPGSSSQYLKVSATLASFSTADSSFYPTRRQHRVASISRDRFLWKGAGP